MSTTGSKRTITVKAKPALKPAVASKPRLAKRVSRAVQEPKPDSDAEIEIEFDDDNHSPPRSKDETDVLDSYLLNSRNNRIADETDEVPIKKEMIGSKAKLRALMNHTVEPSDDEADPLLPPADDAEDPHASEDNSEDENKSTIQDEPEQDAEQEEPVKPTRKPRKPVVRTTTKKTTKTPAVKRGPGRPPKTQKKEPIPRKGISRNPQNPDSFVEVLYDQPIIMKKIFSFFKSVAASEIQMIFRPKDIILYAVDHHEKTRIRIKINAEKLNNYYCRDVLDVGISQKEMEMILNKVDKDYSSIVILSDVATTRRNLTLVFENDIQIDELHRIDLIASYNKMEDEAAFIDEEYTIKFNFPGKYFKKTVSDIKSMSSQLSITQEDNESPLIFEYLTENKRIQSKHTVKDSSKIKLESTLDDGDSFRVDVCIDYLKPISASQIADDICILVDENKPFMTKAYIDGGTIEIKTLTEIIDERPDEDDD